jgi:hypothetical protein
VTTCCTPSIRLPGVGAGIKGANGSAPGLVQFPGTDQLPSVGPNVPATTGGDGDGDLPVPLQKASGHARVYDDAGSACVSRYQHRPCCLLWDGKHRHPELVLRRSIPRPRLTPSPVNASRPPSRTARASLGAGTVRYTFTVTDFHRLPAAGLPALPSTHDPSMKDAFSICGDGAR